MLVRLDESFRVAEWWLLASLHIDGTLQGTSAKANRAIPNGGRPIWIGGNDAWGEYFAGKIDEFRIYNRALSGAEIQALMALEIPSSA